MKRDQITQILQAHRAELERKYGVRSLSLFGSAARDEDGPSGDVDLLVEFARPERRALVLNCRRNGINKSYLLVSRITAFATEKI
jgi:predicted nucleotidyltransferase